MNCGVCVHINGGTCHPVQQCDSCVFNGAEGHRGRTYPLVNICREPSLTSAAKQTHFILFLVKILKFSKIIKHDRLNFGEMCQNCKTKKKKGGIRCFPIIKLHYKK